MCISSAVAKPGSEAGSEGASDPFSRVHLLLLLLLFSADLAMSGVQFYFSLQKQSGFPLTNSDAAVSFWNLSTKPDRKLLLNMQNHVRSHSGDELENKRIITDGVYLWYDFLKCMKGVLHLQVPILCCLHFPTSVYSLQP